MGVSLWYQASHLSYRSHNAELDGARVCVCVLRVFRTNTDVFVRTH